MLVPNPYDKKKRMPTVHKDAFVHETAVVVGNVHIQKGVFIAPYAIIRTDEENTDFILEIGENSNIQDRVVIHSSNNKIGKNVIIAHSVNVHGSQIGDGATLYIGACADSSIIGAGAFLHAHCYVGNVTIPENKLVPPGACIFTQEKADELEDVSPDLMNLRKKVLEYNIAHTKEYLKSEPS